MVPVLWFVFFFFFNDTATTEIYTLSLHDALPITSSSRRSGNVARRSWPDTVPSSDRKSTRLNSSHVSISYAVFCLKKKKNKKIINSYKKKKTRTIKTTKNNLRR